MQSGPSKKLENLFSKTRIPRNLTEKYNGAELLAGKGREGERGEKERIPRRSRNKRADLTTFKSPPGARGKETVSLNNGGSIGGLESDYLNHEDVGNTSPPLTQQLETQAMQRHESLAA